MRTLLRRRHSGPVTADDAGVTLLEVMVAMSVMTVAMTIFTSGMIQIYRSSQRTEASVAAQSELTVLFGRLDREVRYAIEIGEPGSATDEGVGYWYAEYVTVRNQGERWCHGLRVPSTAGSAGLATRTWRLGDHPTPAFAMLASSVQPTPVNPFSLPSARQLRIQVTTAVPAGPADRPATPESDVTFTALNSTGTTGSAELCAQERTDP